MTAALDFSILALFMAPALSPLCLFFMARFRHQVNSLPIVAFPGRISHVDQLPSFARMPLSMAK
jgi:hypothetical protein